MHIVTWNVNRCDGDGSNAIQLEKDQLQKEIARNIQSFLVQDGADVVCLQLCPEALFSLILASDEDHALGYRAFVPNSPGTISHIGQAIIFSEKYLSKHAVVHVSARSKRSWGEGRT